MRPSLVVPVLGAQSNATASKQLRKERPRMPAVPGAGTGTTAAERPGGSVPSPLTHRTVRVDKKLLSFPVSGVFPVSSS